MRSAYVIGYDCRFRAQNLDPLEQLFYIAPRRALKNALGLFFVAEKNIRLLIQFRERISAEIYLECSRLEGKFGLGVPVKPVYAGLLVGNRIRGERG
ncbi:hypothetical protein A3B33_00370 [Candidatus Adlerbacteria bacterium RIFCSPLOWO2_01_FULL_54_16]|uniref:Uncharacterized protein n=1 Tax=Candidatus Adlerbacteria bacterium RIFCSPLOWO2_01_FULL_54_16 TaxID=1797244 RepID=A0A1F4XZW1_9BACT|nr:MAG: hypothetical protein A3B33_00370 [Candidatus Adlerbacteria bacterium RIFCSPLOWO2_01_FULL_54_16]